MNEIPRDERAVTDRDFLNALDLGRPDLAEVRKALEADDLLGAKRALVEHFRTRVTPRWFHDMRDGRLGDLFDPWEGPDPKATVRAEGLLGNRFDLNEGLMRDLGPDLDWYTEEMRGLARVPSSFKRCRFMLDLAIAFKRTWDPKYSRKFAQFMARWLADWPLVVDEDFDPEKAILQLDDGHKAMPTAFRVIHWLDVLYSGLPFAPEVPLETAFGLIKAIWFTALQYRRYEPSSYHPANHHLWERGTAPVMFAIMLPEFPEVAKLLEQGRPVIARHVADSFLPDGGYEERSPHYARFALEMFMMPQWLADLNRIPLLSESQTKLVRDCLESLALITMPDGSLADVGDGLATRRRNAYLLSRGVRVLGSNLAAETLKRLEMVEDLPAGERLIIENANPVEELPLIVHQPDSGYFVARDGWTPRSSAMVMCIPERGIRNHAHDDELSLQLVVRGVPMIGTPMSETYGLVNQQAYVGSPHRGHYYAMTSHNLVLVNGQPARPLDELADNWGKEPFSVTTTWEATADGVRVSGVHEAYPGTRVSRVVDFAFGRGWTVVDRVQGDARGPHIARWHFEYEVEVRKEEGCFLAKKDEVQLHVGISTPGALARLYRDEEWLGKNLLRPGEPPPWVLDIEFGGTGDDELEARFETLPVTR